MRVLYIGSGNPWQGGAGFLVRQNLFLGALSRIADLQLAMFDLTPGPRPEYARDAVAITKPIRTKPSRLKTWFEDKLDPLPRMLRGYELMKTRQEVSALNPDSFGAVFGYRIDFSHFAGVLDHPRLLLDIDDPEHVRNERRLKSLGVPIDRRTLADLEKLKRFEQRAVAGAKLAFVCQPNDQQGWDRTPEVVPNCVDVPANPARNATRPIVLFVGNCAGGPTTPNVDAVRFFIADIWPKIRAAVPAAEFHIVGATSDAARQPAVGAPGVVLRGFVDDLTAAYAEATVSIAPIRFGTGTRVKILEAFAYACPVVSTVAGAEGIDAIGGESIELADDAESFARRTVDLLNDKDRSQSIGWAGHALAQREYDLTTQQRRLESRLKDFLNSIAPASRKAAG